MSRLLGTIRRIFGGDDDRPPDLDATLSELRAKTPTPVLWLLGKTQSGKTSVVRFLTGADVGSTASEIIVEVDDDDGWTVSPAVDEPWVAVFGFYGPEIRPPTMIPEQVRLLRTLLLGQGEGTILRAILAGERAGSFIGREEP